MVYAITARTSGTITIDTCGSTFDTVLYAGTTCGASTFCHDDIGVDLFCADSRTSELSIAASAGVTYYVVVDGYAGTSGPFELGVTGY